MDRPYAKSTTLDLLCLFSTNLLLNTSALLIHYTNSTPIIKTHEIYSILEFCETSRGGVAAGLATLFSGTKPLFARN